MRASRLVPLLCALGLLSGQAWGQGAPPLTNEQREKLAREHYAAGITKYNIAEYQAAIDHFKKAYELKNAPQLQFNIAQSYRLAFQTKQNIEDCRFAIRFYKLYAGNAGNDPQSSQDVQTAREFIEELTPKCPETGVTQPTEPVDKPNPPVEPPIGPVTDPQPPPVGGGERRSGRGWKIAGLASAGVGVVAIGAGFYFFNVAAGKSDDVEEHVQMTTIWDQTAMNLEDEGKSADTNGKISLVIGGALVVGGGVLYYLGMRADDAAKVAVTPMPGGAAVVWGGAF